ncbi:MAG: 5-formyltetrahydrofolate cyclo-ligase [Propionibacteriaceae bacterium]|jgi:5-formyltetrahydrofolate cyclo-ligase|nr:5-formyltetrahydrofolate cyclo-ligase [Propionibacteriaceae bacterium]
MDVNLALGRAKVEVRASIQGQRLALSEEARAERDAARCARILRRLRALRPRCVAAYVSREDEPGTLDVLWELAEAEVEVLLPKMSSGPNAMTSPAWAWWHGEELTDSVLGIPQPTSPPLASDALARADVVLVPGLVGTVAGERLGRGGGWYDRALVFARPEAQRWLLLNDSEVLPEVPTEAHDLKVTSIITESRWIDCAQ